MGETLRARESGPHSQDRSVVEKEAAPTAPTPCQALYSPRTSSVAHNNMKTGTTHCWDQKRSFHKSIRFDLDLIVSTVFTSAQRSTSEKLFFLQNNLVNQKKGSGSSRPYVLVKVSCSMGKVRKISIKGFLKAHVLKPVFLNLGNYHKESTWQLFY